MSSKYVKVKKYHGVYTYESERNTYHGKPDICYYINYKQDGKLYWEKVGWKSQGYSAQLASNIRNERIRQVRHGAMPEVQQKNTFGKLWNEYKKILTNDKSHKELRYNKYLKYLEHKPLRQISKSDMEKLMSELSKNLAPKTVHSILSQVRHMMSKANEWGMYAGTNPVSQISLPKVNNRRVRYLTKEEAELLIKNILQPQTRRMSVLAIETGMRRGEITALTWRDLDFNAEVIYVHGKGGLDRYVYMTDRVRQILGEQAKNSEYVFHLERSENKIRKISESFKNATIRTGLNTPSTDRANWVSFHTLRHTFASWLVMSGVPLLTVKELLGHKTIEMTMRYSHLAPDHKRQAAKIICSQWSPEYDY